MLKKFKITFFSVLKNKTGNHQKRQMNEAVYEAKTKGEAKRLFVKWLHEKNKVVDYKIRWIKEIKQKEK